MRNVLILALALQAMPVLAQPAPPAAAAASAAYSSGMTKIETLLDDPAARAVLDKNVPGLTTNPQIDMARAMTLKDIQGYAADTLTDEVLKKIDADLAALAKK